MKTNLIKLLISIVILITVFSSASAQIYVKIRPIYPIVVRTEPPSHEYVWIDEEWEYHDGKYVYAGGHWANPPRKGYVRRSGHWKHNKHGNIWIRGSWRRR